MSYTVPLPKIDSQNHNVTSWVSRLGETVIVLQTVQIMLGFKCGFEEKRNTTSVFSMEVYTIIKQGEKRDDLIWSHARDITKSSSIWARSMI